MMLSGRWLHPASLPDPNGNMKMSPSCCGGVFEVGIAIVERRPFIERLANLKLSADKAEAARLGMDPQALPFPLHHVVVADDARMSEAADAIQIVRSRAKRRL